MLWQAASLALQLAELLGDEEQESEDDSDDAISTEQGASTGMEHGLASVCQGR